MRITSVWYVFSASDPRRCHIEVWGWAFGYTWWHNVLHPNHSARLPSERNSTGWWLGQHWLLWRISARQIQTMEPKVCLYSACITQHIYMLLPVYELLCPTIRKDNFCRLRSFGSVSFLSQWTNFIRIGRWVVFRGRIGLEYLEGREMVYFIQNDISVSRLSVSFHIWSPILWAAQNKWTNLRFVIISGWDLKDLIGINYKKKRKWGNFKLN